MRLHKAPGHLGQGFVQKLEDSGGDLLRNLPEVRFSNAAGDAGEGVRIPAQ